MAKFLISGSYTAEGMRGLAKDKASGRKAAVEAAIAGLGGKLECVYYAFGENDVYLIVELPDNGGGSDRDCGRGERAGADEDDSAAQRKRGRRSAGQEGTVPGAGGVGG